MKTIEVTIEGSPPLLMNRFPGQDPDGGTKFKVRYDEKAFSEKLARDLVDDLGSKLGLGEEWGNLRDFFAGCALIGLIQGDVEWNMPTAVVTAFQVADHMLTARKANE